MLAYYVGSIPLWRKSGRSSVFPYWWSPVSNIESFPEYAFAEYHRMSGWRWRGSVKEHGSVKREISIVCCVPAENPKVTVIKFSYPSSWLVHLRTEKRIVNNR